MSNPAKNKGSRFERAIVEHLNHHGHPHAERCYGAGRPDDRGDIDGIPGWVIEAKNHRRFALAEWMSELEAETRNARATHGALVIKRRQHPVGQSYVVMTLDTFAELLADDPDLEVA